MVEGFSRGWLRGRAQWVDNYLPDHRAHGGRVRGRHHFYVPSRVLLKIHGLYSTVPTYLPTCLSTSPPTFLPSHLPTSLPTCLSRRPPTVPRA